MPETLEDLQRRVCEAYGVEYTPPAPGSKVGIALRTLDRSPVRAVRVPPTEATCGWFILGGDERSDDPDFYQPLCVEHLADYCQSVLPFLGLPPGWGFYTDGEDYGASFDERLLLPDTD